MKNDVFKVMVLHKNKIVRKIVKEEISKILPYTLFITASTNKSFLKKMEWITPDLVLSSVEKNTNYGLEALIYVRKNLAGVPFIYLTDHKQMHSASLSPVFAEGDGTINYSRNNQISVTLAAIMPSIRKYKRHKKEEFFELHQQILLARKSLALSTKGYLLPQQEARLHNLMNK